MLRKLKVRQEMFRTMPIDIVAVPRAEGDPEDAPTKYRMSVSSEFEVDRGWWTEILSHEASAVDLKRAKRGLSARDSHYGDVIGIGEDWKLNDQKRLETVITFSRNARAQEIETDVSSTPMIRRFVSIGYRILRAKVIEKGSDGSPDRYLITRWEPIHVAFVPDPADYTVGVGRSGSTEAEVEVEIEGADRAEEERMNKCQTHERENCSECQTRDNPGTTTATAPIPTEPSTRQAGPAPAPAITGGEDRSAANAAAVMRLAVEHGMAERAAEWVEKRLSVDQVKGAILDAKRSDGGAQPAPRHDLDLNLSKKDAKRYSLARAILSHAEGKLGGLEREVHDEIERQLPAGVEKRGGVYLPMRSSVRALDTKTAAAGAEIVFDQPGDMIELLRNQALVAAMGARILSGLTAPIPFPKQTGASTAYWVGENPAADVASSTITTGVVTLSPKTIQANAQWSRQLLILASMDVESMVRDDLALVHGLAVDRAALHGIGAGGEPQGIYSLAGVLTEAMGSTVPTYAKIVEMEGKLADANSLGGKLGYLMTPLLAAALKVTPQLSGAAMGWVFNGKLADGEMAGYTARATNQVSKTLGAGSDEHGLIFGNWDDLVIGLWGALEAIVDPYALKKRGMIEVTTFQMADVLVRHPESFCKATAAKAA